VVVLDLRDAAPRGGVTVGAVLGQRTAEAQVQLDLRVVVEAVGLLPPLADPAGQDRPDLLRCGGDVVLLLDRDDSADRRGGRREFDTAYSRFTLLLRRLD
jgi:hypothetical protein